MSQPTNLTQWLLGLPIPWMTGMEVGAADAVAQGTIYDQQVSLAKQAVLARFPDYGPTDALPYIGQDRKLIQGFAEPEESFRVRLRTAWDQWALAGTWAELLFQLYFSAGLSTGSTWIVQQNGYAYNLTADPAPDQDPIPLVNITPLGNNPTLLYPTGVPWWTFDGRTDLCSRFAIVISGVTPGSFLITARAVFNGTSQATAKWSGPFDGVDYNVIMGAAQTTDGTAPTIEFGNRTQGTIDVFASGPFTGYVDLLGYVGSDPFSSPSETTLNVIRKVVNTWKPAKAIFMGIYVVVDGAVWGWPIGTKWGQVGLKWGAGTSEYYAP